MPIISVADKNPIMIRASTVLDICTYFFIIKLLACIYQDTAYHLTQSMISLALTYARLRFNILNYIKDFKWFFDFFDDFC